VGQLKLPFLTEIPVPQPGFVWCRLPGLALLGLILTLGLAASARAQAGQTPPGDSGAQQPAEPPEITGQLIQNVFEPLLQGMEAMSLKQVMAAFDPEDMPDYAQFRDRIDSLLRSQQAIRFRYKLLQVTAEKDRASALAEIDLANTPADQTQAPVTRSTEMRFQMRLYPQGWRVIGLQPEEFFSPPR